METLQEVQEEIIDMYMYEIIDEDEFKEFIGSGSYNHIKMSLILQNPEELDADMSVRELLRLSDVDLHKM